MLNDDIIKWKVAARNAAMMVHGLAVDESYNHPTKEGCLEFWKTMLRNVLIMLSESEHPVQKVYCGSKAPMTDAEAKVYERTIVQFGLYVGRMILDIPWDYLDWLDEQPNFREKLNRYLRSEYVHRQRRNEHMQEDEEDES